MEEAALRFTVLYDTHYRQLMRYALAYLDPDSAQDVVAEAFVVAWRKMRHVPDDPLPWLLCIVRNLRLKHRERERRDHVLSERIARFTTVRDLQAWDAAVLAVDRRAALAALARLPADDLELLVLTIWHGLNANEAAVVLGCKPTAAAVRLHRARRRLTAAVAATLPVDTAASLPPQALNVNERS